jgi:fucose permease
VQELHPDEPGRYINFTHSFWSVGVLVTVLISGGLISSGVSWRIPVAAVGAVGFIAAAMLLIRSRKYACCEHPEPVHWTDVCSRTVTILKCRRFWLFFAAMFVAGGGEFCLTFWCASFIQLNFLDAAWAGGVGTALFAGGMVIGRTGAGYFVHQNHLKHLIVGCALVGTAVTLLFPHIESLWVMFVLLFFAGLATAPFWPSVQGYSIDRLPKLDTTMLLVLLSCAGVPGCGVFTWLMGYVGDYAGLATAFYLVPACYVILAALIGWDGWLSRSARAADVATQ